MVSARVLFLAVLLLLVYSYFRRFTLPTNNLLEYFYAVYISLLLLSIRSSDQFCGETESEQRKNQHTFLCVIVIEIGKWWRIRENEKMKTRDTSRIQNEIFVCEPNERMSWILFTCVCVCVFIKIIIFIHTAFGHNFGKLLATKKIYIFQSDHTEGFRIPPCFSIIYRRI